MKFKTTRKAINDNYNTVIGIGYCNAQNLLAMQEPRAYSSGVYGWNCDYYIIDHVVICTGYRQIINKNNTCDYKMVQLYDSIAETINHDRNISYEEKQEKLDKLLNEFIEKVTA